MLDTVDKESSRRLAVALMLHTNDTIIKMGFLFLSMTKSVDAGLGVDFFRVEPCRGKGWLVGTVGKMLCFETEAVLFVIGMTQFSYAAVEKISGVELYAGLSGQASEGSPANRFDHFSGDCERAVSVS